MKKRRIKEGRKCECGGEQDADNRIACLLIPIKCRKEDCMTVEKKI